MHWNVVPDALIVSARLVRILDHWYNDCLGAIPHTLGTSTAHFDGKYSTLAYSMENIAHCSL